MASINSSIKVASVGATLILILAGCPGSRVCPDAVYQFAVIAEFSPEKDSIRAGDTLYLVSSFSTKLMDAGSGNEVDYANAVSIGSNVFVQEIPPDKSAIKDAVSNFAFFSLKGQIYNDATVPVPEGVNQLAYSEIDSRYELRVGFIPKKKGIFCLTVGNGFSNGKPDDNCDKASLAINVINPNQHLSYLADYLGSSTVAPFSKRGGYCFKVY